MTQGKEIKFSLLLDGSQYTGVLSSADAATRRFGDTAANTSRRASDAMRSMAEAGAAVAGSSQRAGDSVRSYAGGADIAAIAQQRFLAGLQSQLAVVGRSETELLQYRAAQLGVGHSAQALITQLTEARTAVAAKATADAAAAAAARDHAAAASAQASAQRQFIDSLKQQVATQGMGSAELLRYRAAQLGVGEQAEHLIGQLRATGRAGQISAGQTAQAWAQLPMQMQDVAVTLAGGMNPLMVLMQQGPQITSSFGGVRPAISAIAGAITPMVAGLVAGGVAVTALAMASYQAGQEGAAYAKSLITTGNAAGTTAGQMQVMAASIAQTVGTQGAAAESLAAMAGTGRIAADQLQRMAQVAVQWERTTGTAVDEVAKQFSALAKAPLSASLQLNESLHHLTRSTYLQIRSLEEQGRTTEAARLAQEAYAKALEERSGQMVARLGYVARAWTSIKDASAGAWDAIVNIGREDTTETKLATIDAQIKRIHDRGPVQLGGSLGRQAEEQRQAELAKLEAQRRGMAIEASDAAKRAGNRAAEAKQIEARAAWDKDALGYLDKREQRERAIAKIRGEAAAAGVSDAEVQKRIAAINDKYKDPKAPKTAAESDFRAAQAAQVALDTARAKSAAQAAADITEAERAALERRHALGLESASSYYAALASLAQQDTATRLAEIDKRISAESSRKTDPKKPSDAIQQQARLEELAAERTHALAESRARAAAMAGQAERQELDASRATMQQWASAMESAQQQAETLAGQQARAQAQLITDPLRRARAEAEITAQEIERTNSRAAVGLRNQIDILRGNGMEAQASALQVQLDAIQSGATSAARAARSAPDLKALQDYLGADNIGLQVADGFDKASQSLSAFVRSFSGLIKVQSDYDTARAAAGTDAAQLAAVEAKHQAQRLTGYATMAGAAKGIFREHTAAYKVMAGAEKAFRLAEMAGAAQSAAVKMGLISAETSARLSGYADTAVAAVKSAGTEIAAALGIGQANAVAGVAGQAKGDPYTAFPRMAAMAAAMAALGFAVSAIGGSRGSAPVTNTGTGTVLGDKDARSESIAKSLDALADVDKLTMQYSAQMAASLRNIETSIGGVSNLLARSGRVQDVAAGVRPGYSGGLTMLGDLGAKLFGSKTTVLGQGLTGAAQSLGEILANGTLQAAYYADVEKKKKFLGVTVSTKVSTQLQDADSELEQQFGSILASFAGGVRSAAGPLGVATAEVEQRLRAFVVNIGKVDLQGLTGEQVSEKLSNVFGAVGDNLARAALVGFDAFQAVGEGYLQTVVRVASATETATDTLRRLGLGAVSLADVVNKQGDVGAELVRQSITRVELLAGGAASSLGTIIGSLDGSAQELADTYRTLLDVRGVLRTIGADGEAVTSDLIRGAGGLSALKDGLGAYEDKFLTAAEQTAIKTGRMTAEFSRLGVALPTTAADFRKLVEGTSTATAAGQAQLGGLLALSSAFSDFLGETTAATEAVKSAADVAGERATLEDRLLTIQGNTAALRARELAKLDESNRALQERVWALEDEKKAAEALASAGKGVQAFIDELRGVTGGSASIAQRRASYAADLAAAQAGDADASGRVTTTAKALVDAVKASATDPLAVARETSRIAAQLQELPATVAYQAAKARADAQAQGQLPGAMGGPLLSTAAPVAAPVGAPLPGVGSAAAAAPADPTRTLLERLLAEVASLRAEQAGTGASIAASTGKTARILEAITPDGDAVATRATR